MGAEVRPTPRLVKIPLHDVPGNVWVTTESIVVPGQIGIFLNHVPRDGGVGAEVVPVPWLVGSVADELEAYLFPLFLCICCCLF